MSKLFTCSDGHMYNTEVPDWHKLPPLRTNYAKVTRDFPFTTAGSIALRAALRQRYAWPGGYEFVFIVADGACLCSKCVLDNYRLVASDRRNLLNCQWAVTCMALEEEIGDAYCEHCHREFNEGEEQ